MKDMQSKATYYTIRHIVQESGAIKAMSLQIIAQRIGCSGVSPCMTLEPIMSSHQTPDASAMSIKWGTR